MICLNNLIKGIQLIRLIDHDILTAQKKGRYSYINYLPWYFSSYKEFISKTEADIMLEQYLNFLEKQKNRILNKINKNINFNNKLLWDDVNDFEACLCFFRDFAEGNLCIRNKDGCSFADNTPEINKIIVKQLVAKTAEIYQKILFGFKLNDRDVSWDDIARIYQLTPENVEAVRNFNGEN